MNADTFRAHEGIFMKFGERTFWLLLSGMLSRSFALLVIALLLMFLRESGFIMEGATEPLAIAGMIVWAVFFISIFAALLSARIIYRNNTFAFGSDAFRVKRGVFTKLEIAIPYQKVQNVEIERTISHRMFGVSKMIIITAGTDDPRTARNEALCTLPVIDKEIAEGLQEELLRRAGIHKVQPK